MWHHRLTFISFEDSYGMLIKLHDENMNEMYNFVFAILLVVVVVNMYDIADDILWVSNWIRNVLNLFVFSIWSQFHFYFDLVLSLNSLLNTWIGRLIKSTHIFNSILLFVFYYVEFLLFLFLLLFLLMIHETVLFLLFLWIKNKVIF